MTILDDEAILKLPCIQAKATQRFIPLEDEGFDRSGKFSLGLLKQLGVVESHDS